MTNSATPLKLLNWWTTRGVAEGDSADLRLKKSVMTLVSSAIAFLALFWGALYAATGYLQPGLIPWSYAVVSLLSTLYFFYTKRFGFFCFNQQLLILLLPFLLMWRLGGFANGSVVMIWAFFAPLAALFFIDLRAAGRWMLAFMVLLGLSAWFDPLLAAMAPPMPTWLNSLYFFLNLGVGFLLVALMIYYFVRDREQAYQRLAQSRAHIQQLLMIDELTQVGNRRSLNRRLQEELLRAERYHSPLSIIMLDVDHFKAINDRYGHAMGDEVLVIIARTLEECIRESDFLARYGGEEFIILLPETDMDGGRDMAERIRERLRRLPVGTLEAPPTASFGVAGYVSGDSSDSLLNRVDHAMYRAKDEGRDRVCIL